MPLIHTTSEENAVAILEGGFRSSYDVEANEDELVYAEDGMSEMLRSTQRYDEFLDEYVEEGDEILELAGLWRTEFGERGQIIWVTSDGEAWAGGTRLEFIPPEGAVILYRKFTSLAYYVPGDRIPPRCFARL